MNQPISRGRYPRRSWSSCERLESRRLLSSLPPGFAETQIASGIGAASAMAIAPDGRVFIATQTGDVRVVQNGQLLAKPLLSLTTTIGAASQGLMGIALDPKFETNGYVYVDYTVGGTEAYQRISRFTANGNTVVAGSERDLFEIGPQTNLGHIGGALHFGADGKLYFTYGDCNISDPAIGSQLNNFYTKMIRINPDGSIPTDNPFYNQTTGPYRAIWAMGLRNAFTFAVQPGTGLIYINDVGEATWEEVDQGKAGVNYGWPDSEGPNVQPGETAPVYAYLHTGAPNNPFAITGGTFYDPPTQQFPASYAGKYFFADWGQGTISTIDPANPSTASVFVTGAPYIIDLGVGPGGTLYYLTRGNNGYGFGSPDGQLFAIKYTGRQTPGISVQPTDVTAAPGDSATFAVTPTGTGPFTYQWQRGGVNISNATQASYTIGSLSNADNGATFDVVVSSSFGHATSRIASLDVVPRDPPTASIVCGNYYSAGASTSFFASATDPIDGALPASDFTWRVDLHRGLQVTTYLAVFSGTKQGSFAVPTAGQQDPNTYYQVILTVTNSAGLSTTITHDCYPRATLITLASNVADVGLSLDGSAITMPAVSVQGSSRVISAPATQVIGGKTYAFASWSDGGAATHSIITPVTSAITYTAQYVLASLPSPWQRNDIGVVANAGGAAYASGAFTISGGGADIWGSSDAFDFVNQTWTGDGTIIARVASQTNSNAWAKVGLMFRSSLAANSAFAAIYVTPTKGVSAQARKSGGAAAAQFGAASGQAPIWLKLVRAGNVFTASISSDGSTWKVVGQTTVAMSASIYVGLAITSHDNSTTSTAVLDHVAVTP